MKKNINMIIIMCALVAVFLGLIIWSLVAKKSEAIDYDKYDFANYIEGTEDNGYIADHVKGDIEKAKVVIVEYADYQCPGCATSNPRINKLVEEYDGDLAVIYRNYLLSYHQNGTAAASAAEAAALQGYWKDYADSLFSNQSTWEYASADERTDLFVDMFTEVTNGEGDVDKFKEDMGSDAVSKKISFDMGIGNRIEISGTPSFYLNGEKIDMTNVSTEDDFLEMMRELIDKNLKV